MSRINKQWADKVTKASSLVEILRHAESIQEVDVQEALLKFDAMKKSMIMTHKSKKIKLPTWKLINIKACFENIRSGSWTKRMMFGLIPGTS
jgi:hypothetical protein